MKNNFVSSNIVNLHRILDYKITKLIDNDLNFKGSLQIFWEEENLGVGEHW